MKITPDQIRAARALLRLEQHEVAERAHVSLAAVAAAETAEDADPIATGSVRAVLEQEGAEFIPLGVRRRPAFTAEQQARYERLMELSRESAAALAGRTDLLTDADLYDENGLPA